MQQISAREIFKAAYRNQRCFYSIDPASMPHAIAITDVRTADIVHAAHKCARNQQTTNFSGWTSTCYENDFWRMKRALQEAS